MADFPRSTDEVFETASSFVAKGDVDGLRAYVQELEDAGHEDWADIAALCIETAISYRDNP